MRVLVIEDEIKVVEFLRKGLSDSGYEVEVAFDGQMGLRLATGKPYDLVILDLVLPQMNGFEVCRKLREMDNNVPVLMLTALVTTDNKLEGFQAGADDYLTKPFEFNELLARLNALSKRSHAVYNPATLLRVDDLELDLERKIAKRGSTIIELTAKEYALLEYLIRNRGKVVSRMDIAEKVWDINFDTGTNTVDVYINLLRKKIDRNFEKKLIHTKIGMGYTLDTD